MRAFLVALALSLASLAVVPAAEAITMPVCVGGPGYCREVVCVTTDSFAECSGDYYPCAGVVDPFVMVCLGNGPG